MLEARKLTAGYGPVVVLHGVDITVMEGEIVCIIGPNGAGKSTVLRAVAGQITPLEGRVLFGGRDVTKWSIADKGREGLIFIPQGENVFPNLTVYENLEIAGSLVADRGRLHRAIESVYETFPIIAENRNRPARVLSGGERQMLALGRVLIIQPRLVLLDEPSLGLSPLVVDLIFDKILEMNRQGVSFLLVEQNARKGLSVSHRGYVLELGRNRMTGTGAELLDNPQLQKLYLGG
ncbi:MAG: ABC transporter ATP-binding protein [Deltaproteobacteria bacterium]|nr:ABC transporter ATP-binding protein [Deltaproteobacteria bacterium]